MRIIRLLHSVYKPTAYAAGQSALLPDDHAAALIASGDAIELDAEGNPVPVEPVEHFQPRRHEGAHHNPLAIPTADRKHEGAA